MGAKTTFFMPLGSSVSLTGDVLEMAACSFGTWTRNLPRRLEIGLIEAGKRAARVDAFELREEVRLFAVEPLEDARAAFLADFSLVGDVDARFAGGQSFGGTQTDKIVVARLDGGGLGRDGGLPDGKFGGVQPHQRRGLGELDIDIDGAGEGLFAGDEREVGGIPDGAYVFGKPKFRRFGGNGRKRTERENETYGLHEVHSIVAGSTLRALRW